MKEYLRSSAEVLEEVSTSLDGLSSGEAASRLEKNGNLWTITMPSLAAHEYAEEFVLDMGNGHTVTYSAYSYIYTAQQSGKEALVNVANALGAYGYATGVFSR